MKKRLLIITLQLGMGALDGRLTARNMDASNPQEHNPFARPFVTHGDLELAGYFAFTTGSAIAGAEILNHYHHNYLAHMVEGWQIGNNAAGAIISAEGHK